MDISPAAAPLEARFQLNTEDDRAFNTLTRNSGVSNTRKLFRLMVVLFPALIIAFFVFRANLDNGTAASDPLISRATLMSVLSLVLPVGLFGGFWILLAVVHKKEQAENIGLVESTLFRLDPNGATNVCGPYTNITQWRGFILVIATETHIAFQFNNSGGHIVPRRAFESDESWQRFVKFASDQWHKTQPETPPIAAA